MWKSKTLFKESIQELVNNNLINEVLIINNDVKQTPQWDILSHEKLEYSTKKKISK